MLLKKALFFLALVVALFLTWFVMDTVSDIPKVTVAAGKKAEKAEAQIARLHESYSKQCTADSDCIMVPASCQSCNCNFEAVAVSDAENYGEKRAEICRKETGAMKATCDLYCPKRAACVEQLCTIQPLEPVVQ